MSVLDISQQVSLLTKSSLSSGNREEMNLRADATQTERANYDFYCQAKQIEGAQVSVYGGEIWSERIIVVVVPDVFDATADAVLDLNTQIHQSYPAARLNVRVTEAASNIAAVI